MHKTVDLLDAQAMHRKHRNTFEVPSDAELAALRPGDYVKVCAGRERFWVEVDEFDGATIHATVASALVLTSEHGLKSGDALAFEPRHVLSVE